jgi:hypothetical protein
MNAEIVILYLSDCCGEYLSDDHVQYEICPRCKEHCEVLTEECAVENDMILLPLDFGG